MLNSILYKFTKKNIVLISNHRQAKPILKDKENREKYIFIKLLIIWRILPLPSKYKIKYIFVYWMLNLIQPKFIIDINWIGKWQSLYKVWTKNHPKSKFIVIQHGSYVGGIVTDIPHRYTKCDIFLVWSDYFKNMFENYNKGKKVEIITFGNPVYNQIDRSAIKEKINNGKKILLLFSAIAADRLRYYYQLINKLREIGFTLYLKQHNFQGKKEEFPIVENIEIETRNIFDLLSDNDYEFIIADHTSAMLDAIFFKNRIIYFAPPGKYKELQKNKYSEFLINLFYKVMYIQNAEQLTEYLDYEATEKLFSELISLRDNSLNSVI